MMKKILAGLRGFGLKMKKEKMFRKGILGMSLGIVALTVGVLQAYGAYSAYESASGSALVVSNHVILDSVIIQNTTGAATISIFDSATNVTAGTNVTLKDTIYVPASQSITTATKLILNQDFKYGVVESTDGNANTVTATYNWFHVAQSGN